MSFEEKVNCKLVHLADISISIGYLIREHIVLDARAGQVSNRHRELTKHKAFYMNIARNLLNTARCYDDNWLPLAWYSYVRRYDLKG